MFKMKKLSKKVLALSLAATMLFAATGCGKDDDAKKTDNDTKATPTEATAPDAGKADPTAAPAEKTTIRLFRNTFNVDPSDPTQVKKVQDAVNAYIADKGNVQVEITEIGNSEYKEKSNLALVNGEIDLMFTANWLETVGCDDLVKQNAVYDITTLLPNYGVYTALPEWIWGASSYDGKNYFIPNLKEVTEGYNLMFRSDLIAKYGWDLSTVKSLKDIEPMLADCKAEGLAYPYLTQHHPLFFRYYIDRFDFFAQDSFMAVDKTADAVVNTVQTPEYLEFATIMGDFAAKGYINDNDLTKTTPETTTQTQDWGISWWTDVPNNEEADTRYVQSVDMVQITDNWIGSNTTLGSCYAISAKCDEKTAGACLEFLTLLNTDTTLANLMAFGIEGEDYNMVNGVVTKTDNGKYNHGAWETASVNVVGLEPSDPANKLELYDEFNLNGQTSIAAGFRFDSTPVDASYASCQQIFQEFGYALENGGFTPEQVPGAIADYQAALDGAGYQEVLAEAQAQYDAWKAVR